MHKHGVHAFDGRLSVFINRDAIKIDGRKTQCAA